MALIIKNIRSQKIIITSPKRSCKKLHQINMTNRYIIKKVLSESCTSCFYLLWNKVMVFFINFFNVLFIALTWKVIIHIKGKMHAVLAKNPCSWFYIPFYKTRGALHVTYLSCFSLYSLTFFSFVKYFYNIYWIWPQYIGDVSF